MGLFAMSGSFQALLALEDTTASRHRIYAATALAQGGLGLASLAGRIIPVFAGGF
jgi:hypothetical protein